MTGKKVPGSDKKPTTTLLNFFSVKPKNSSNAKECTPKSKSLKAVPKTPPINTSSTISDEENASPAVQETSLTTATSTEKPLTVSSEKATKPTVESKRAAQKKKRVIIESDEEDEEEEWVDDESEEEKKTDELPVATKSSPRKSASVRPNLKEESDSEELVVRKPPRKKQATESSLKKTPPAVSPSTVKKPARATKSQTHQTVIAVKKSTPNASGSLKAAASAWGSIFTGTFEKDDHKKKRKSSSDSSPAGTTHLKAPYTAGDHLPVLVEPQEFFDDMIKNQLCDNGKRADILKPLLKTLQNRGPLKIATMCSGTESPVLSLDMLAKSIEDFMQTKDASTGGNVKLRMKHVFSCEIEPAKQSYIERNFQPPLLFRDIRELGDDQARTAYGSLVDVPNTPGCVDILVAGTSCVDYSNLNTKKKQLEEGGESGQTFQGMIKWIDKAKPPIVILENVSGAPWEKKIKLMQSYGYAATFERVDTKNFYIPHTRQRGYLFAVRKDSSKALDEKRVRGWKATIAKLKRPASAPLDAMMLPSNDPRVLRGRARLTLESSSGGQAGDSRAGRVDWSKCETRHVRARVDEELGDKRVFTQWSDTGKTTLPFWAWNDWASAQVHRVHDLMDINTLRLAQEDVDNTYKTMVWNLSQNVDRDTMGKLGLTMCLTPSGIPYVTSRGGPLVGEELLLLQGIPADDLLLTKESEDLLKDMAGNAMSTTVVGACILAALLHGHEALREQPDSAEDHEDQSDLPSLVPRSLVPASNVEITQDFGTYGTKTLNLGPPNEEEKTQISRLLLESWLSSRKCVSEGPDEALLFDSIVECADCGQTASRSLTTPPGHYEEHKFQPVRSLEERIPPSVYRKNLLDALPVQLTVANFDIETLDKPDGVGNKLWEEWKAHVQRCTGSSDHESRFAPVFRFSYLERSHIWTAHFASSSREARLELQIRKNSAEWLLFAEPPSKRGPLRDSLERPVARLQVDASSGSMIEGVWELRLPVDSYISVSIEAIGASYPSWKSKLGLKQFENEIQFQNLRVEIEDEEAGSELKRKIAGIYQHLPKCGSACGSLHKKEISPGEEDVYFFLDSGRRTLPQDDAFVFASTCQRTEYMEHREVFLEICKKLQYRPVFPKLPGDLERTTIVKARIPGKWIAFPPVKLQSLESSRQLVPCSIPTSALSVPIKAGWRSVPEIISCNIPVDGSDEILMKCKEGRDINLRKSKQILRSLSFVTSRFELPEFFCQGKNCEVWLTLDRREIEKIGREDPICQECAPNKPGVRWTIVSKGNKRMYKPIEDGREAAAYEAALKSRPNPWSVRLTTVDVEGATETGTKALRLQIGCNAFSLCQRALGRFPSETQARITMIQKKGKEKHTCIYEWRLVPHLEKCFGDFPKLSFKSNKQDAPADQPKNFKLKLRPEQLRSLSWMLEQERSDCPFMEEEITESVLPSLEWRAEGRVQRPVLVRGGCIADEVGYGKTCITLACIDQNQLPSSNLEEDVAPGLIATKATLVVVPAHLLGQWPAEIKKFLGDSKTVVTINDMTSFNNATVADILNADIVVVNFHVLCSDLYYKRLAKLSGKNPKSVPTGKIGGRHFDAVYQECLESLPARVEHIKANCRSASEAIESDASNCKLEEDQDVDYRMDGKRTVYKNTEQKTNKVDNKSKVSKEAEIGDPWHLSRDEVKKDYTKMRCPSLEMFHWQRLVCDEFTYLLEKADRQRPLALVRRLSSEYRWFLSGTPSHESFDDVKALAELLGVHLGIDEPFPGTKVRSKSVPNDNTGLECLSQFSEVRSFQWHERRHRKAQEFMNRFVRQNIAEIDEIPYEEHECQVNFTSAENAIYRELDTTLKALEMNHSSAQLSKKKSQSDRENRMQAILQGSESAEEALLKCATSCNVSGTKSALRTCQDIIDCRRTQKTDLEKEMVEFITAALRQRNRIEKEQSGWSKITKAEKGEVLDSFGHFLKDAAASSSISAGADDEIHKRVKELVATAEAEFKTTPYEVDRIFAEVNDADAVDSNNNEGEHEDNDDEDEADPESASKKAKLSVKKKKEKRSDRDRLIDMKLALRNHVHNIRSLGKELCGRMRSLRYITQIRGLQKSHGVNDMKCVGCNAAGLTVKHQGILSCCGHTGCLDCLKRHAINGNCLHLSCKARVNAAHIVPALSLGTDDENDNDSQDGSKLAAIVSKVNEIIAAGDRIILFVQFDELKEKVIQALRRNSIKAEQVKGKVKDQINALAPFMKENPGRDDPRVLVLRMDHESASGLNLTHLNHAIFVHPLLAATQQQYEAYETQSIGRIRRYGQVKNVNVWRFLVKGSIDTEIYEQRTGRQKEVTK